MNAVLPGWLFDSNYAFSDLGKIWITWLPSVKLFVLSKSLKMISCEVFFPASTSPVIICFVYTSTDDMDRRLLWSELTSLATDHRVMGKPWAVLGDFNQVLRPSENSAAVGPNVDLSTRLFAESLILGLGK
uniref:Endonuclease/exonuclease/phosphatase domain-containing protein n=1 Tax=Brassica oleracea var. oleracea TaxID=109376 RepID=A0A0D3D7Z3_BRAOL